MILIRPYVEFDGIPTMRDSEIKNLYDLMERDGTAATVFFDGGILSSEAFLNFIKSPGVMLFVAHDGNVPVGCGWLSHFEYKTARAHFCIFSEAWGENSVRVGRDLVEKAMASIDGLDMIIGFIPSKNYKAIKFAIACGAVLVGEFPCGSVDIPGNSHPTSILYYMR